MRSAAASKPCPREGPWEALDVVEASPAPAANDAPGGQARPTRPAWVGEALERGVDSRTRIALVPGKLIPGTRYRIQRWLGDGGMGSVYEATHVDVGRTVALKVLHARVAQNAEATAAFRDEARAAARIPSDYIVQVYDFAELADGRLLFTMEHLDGHDLGDELERGPMDLDRFFGLARQICQGLHDAHRAGLVHRDVKPDNIMVLARPGGRDVIKLLDFGVATVLDEESVENVEAAGTAHYLAPEIISGIRFDTRADLYSFGCMAFELLCGHPPFDDEAIENVLADHLTREPPRLTREDLPEPLAGVIRRCLAKDPDDRYTDMADLEAALCEAQIACGLRTAWDDLPLPDVPPERLDQLLPLVAEPIPTRTTPRRLVMALAVGLTLLGGIGTTMYAAAPPLTAQTSVIEALTERSRAAGARAYFVYPPTDAPHQDTAYSNVKALRDLGTRAATERADALSDEFADTLTRLGDEYWERPGGKPFSIDYYVQALVFDPERPSATARAQLTPGQLIDLERKASELTFSEAELIAAAPLAALASATPEDRAERIHDLRVAGYAASATINASLELLVPERAQAPATAEAVDDSSPAPKQATAPSDRAEPKPARRDRRRAKSLAGLGWKSARAGDLRAAERTFEQALAQDPRHPAALDGLAKVNFDLARYSTAASFAKRAVQAAPKNGGYRIRLGDAYYKLYRYDDAVDQYARAASLGHTAAAARLTKAKAKAK